MQIMRPFRQDELARLLKMWPNESASGYTIGSARR